MTSPDTADLRVGDRITVLAGKARSGHTYNVLTRGFTIDVTYARRHHTGDIDVEGILLTTRGAWRSGLPSRSVNLPAGSYTTPIRVGDTVRYPHTGETPVVTAIHERPDGTALADLLFRSGTTGTGLHLFDLEHLARPATPPTRQPCLRRHDPALACARCAEAAEAVTTGCDAALCSRPAANLVVWMPRSGSQQAKALCPPDTGQFTSLHRDCAVRVIPLAAGTYTYLADGTGTQVATCYHCGHAIYLYAALARQPEPWRDGEYDETGRCPVGEERTATRVMHEPATTLAERDYARTAATCGTTADLHSLADCPARRP
jgi:hypothetical protein